MGRSGLCVQEPLGGDDLQRVSGRDQHLCEQRVRVERDRGDQFVELVIVQEIGQRVGTIDLCRYLGLLVDRLTQGVNGILCPNLKRKRGDPEDGRDRRPRDYLMHGTPRSGETSPWS